MSIKKITITEDQRKKLMELWFVYGNNGKKHTHHNHRYIQNFIEHDEDTEDFYRKAYKGRIEKAGIDWSTVQLTEECVEAVKQILNENK